MNPSYNGPGLTSNTFIVKPSLVNFYKFTIFYHALQPPSTFKTSPVIYFAASEARNRQALATSIEAPQFFCGILSMVN